jgi:hypothetical protein
LSDAIQQAIDTLIEIKRLHQLNFELLEQLNVSCQYIVDNKIEISNERHLRSLLNKSMALVNELDGDQPKILQYSISRRKVTDSEEFNGTDEEVTEPFKAIFKGGNTKIVPYDKLKLSPAFSRR